MDKLAKEHSEQVYGEATSWLVLAFRNQYKLNDANNVDVITADLINSLLDQLGKPDDNIKIPYTVQGTLWDANNQHIVGSTVRAYDQDVAGENFLGEGFTDQAGFYRISFTESQFRRSASEVGGPDLIVKALDASGQFLAQSKRLRNSGLYETIDLRVGGAHFIVSGIVLHLDGHPAPGVTVLAYDQDLRSRQLLGQDVTDTSGSYTIAYTSMQFNHAENANADLFVAAMDQRGSELVTSDVLYDAPQQATIDLILPLDKKTLSEYELLLQSIQPLLVGQGQDGADLAINGLIDSDIPFLAQESGASLESITPHYWPHSNPLQPLPCLHSRLKSFTVGPGRGCQRTWKVCSKWMLKNCAGRYWMRSKPTSFQPVCPMFWIPFWSACRHWLPSGCSNPALWMKALVRKPSDHESGTYNLCWLLGSSARKKRIIMVFYTRLVIFWEQHDEQNPWLAKRAHQTLDKTGIFSPNHRRPFRSDSQPY